MKLHNLSNPPPPNPSTSLYYYTARGCVYRGSDRPGDCRTNVLTEIASPILQFLQTRSLQIEDTSLFRNTDVCSTLKQVLTILVELHTTDERPRPTSLFNPCASYRWLTSCWDVSNVLKCHCLSRLQRHLGTRKW